MASFFGEVLAPRSRIIDDEDLDAQEGNFWRLDHRFQKQQFINSSAILIFTKLVIYSSKTCIQIFTFTKWRKYIFVYQ